MLQSLIHKTLDVTTEKDNVLQNLVQFVLFSWPDKKCEVPDHIALFLNVHDVIGIMDGVLLKGIRIIIPETP